MSSGASYIGKRIDALHFSGSEGNAIVEFALVLPILLMVVTGIWQFGVAYNHFIVLTQAATAGAQTLQSDRLSPADDPCADTYNAIVNAAPTLNPAKVSLTISMNGGAAITKNTCSGQQTQLAMGGPVTVQATYPYTLTVAGLSLVSGNMSSGTISEISY
jgi:Flp pilus assembly protein TadG